MTAFTFSGCKLHYRKLTVLTWYQRINKKSHYDNLALWHVCQLLILKTGFSSEFGTEGETNIWVNIKYFLMSLCSQWPPVMPDLFTASSPFRQAHPATVWLIVMVKLSSRTLKGLWRLLLLLKLFTIPSTLTNAEESQPQHIKLPTPFFTLAMVLWCAELLMHQTYFWNYGQKAQPWFHRAIIHFPACF